MTIAIGYIVAAVITVMGVWLVAGRAFAVERDPKVNLAEIAGRHTGIMSGLAGFAITGLVLLVTLGRSLPNTSDTSYTTVVTMFFIAWMAFSATAFLFANIADPGPSDGATRDPGFDVPAAQFAGAAITLEFAFGLGWLALRPLFLAFGLERLAEIAVLTSIVIAPASYGLVAHQLRRAGYGPGRVLAAIPLLAVAATLSYAAIVGLLGIRSQEAALEVIVVGFCLGAVGFFALTTLTITAAERPFTGLLWRYGRYVVLAFAQCIVLFVGFVLLAVLGLG